MDDIVEKDRTNLTPKNVEAIGFIKYDLRARGLRAIQMVPSDQMIKNVISAHASYTVHLEREAHLAKKKNRTLFARMLSKKGSWRTASASSRLRSSSYLIQQLSHQHRQLRDQQKPHSLPT